MEQECVNKWIGQQVGQSRKQEKQMFGVICKHINILSNGKQASSKYRSESITEQGSSLNTQYLKKIKQH